jgi:hypothetical protein
MNETAIQTPVQPGEPISTAADRLSDRPPIQKTRSRLWPFWKALQVAGSLRVTVVLFVLAILLIFFGTLAQVDEGIWAVVSKYFRCLLAWIPLKIFFPRQMRQVPGGFPFPGGWTIAGLLLVNLLAAHATRFRVTWKRSGVLILHAGLIIMIGGEFITGMFAVENNMRIFKGKSVHHLTNLEAIELAFVAPVDDDTEHAIVVPGSLLLPTKKVQYDSVPFDIVVEKYMPNSEMPRPVKDGEDNLATAGIGLHRVAVEKPATNGIDPEGNVDRPSAYLTIIDRATGKKLGTYLFSLWFDEIFFMHEPQRIELNGRPYDVELRFKRTYTPYRVHLEEVKTEYYPGTQTPRSFTSRIDMIDPERDVDREVNISMNEPLRYGGQTFYQAGVRGADMVTVLQVVRNPGWPLPYISCITVAVGMLVHFGIQLITFLRRRAVA